MAIPTKMLVYIDTKQLFVDGLFDFGASQRKVKRWVCAVGKFLLGSNK